MGVSVLCVCVVGGWVRGEGGGGGEVLMWGVILLCMCGGLMWVSVCCVCGGVGVYGGGVHTSTDNSLLRLSSLRRGRSSERRGLWVVHTHFLIVTIGGGWVIACRVLLELFLQSLV